MEDLKSKILIRETDLESVNKALLEDETITQVLEVVEELGGVEVLNDKHRKVTELDYIMNLLKEQESPFLKDLLWLIEAKNTGAFISMEDYCKDILGDDYNTTSFEGKHPVTLEISALNSFQWFIDEAHLAVEKRELMPQRYILVRSMQEQLEIGELLPLVAAMKIIGASFVETLDTKGTLPGPDGAPINKHLGGPTTITGYFGGVGCPNQKYVLDWTREFLHFYSEYGVKQVLNLNPGTVLVAYILHKIGIDIEMKISVFMGNDNPTGVFWTLLGAKLFSREDGTTSLIGFNLSNSVDNDTILQSSVIRERLGFTDNVRIEHHITETYLGIVRQPYDRTDELVELNGKVPNISAKHEGGKPLVEEKEPVEKRSNILDYFAPKNVRDEMNEILFKHYLLKHDALNFTARELIKNGIPVIPAPNLHQKL